MDDAAPSLIGCQALEQFVLLSKSARGPAVPELIKQALAAPGVYVFGELLEADSVRELAGGANANYLQLLEIFAYGTYSDYKGTGICGHHNLQSRYECFLNSLSLSVCGSMYICRGQSETLTTSKLKELQRSKSRCKQLLLATTNTPNFVVFRCVVPKHENVPHIYKCMGRWP